MSSNGSDVVVVKILASPSNTTRINGANNDDGVVVDGRRKVVEDENGGIGSSSSSCSFMLLMTAILFPPLAMGLLVRFHLKHPMDMGEKVRQVVVCFLLTSLCYIPGLLHVIFAMLQEEAGD